MRIRALLLGALAGVCTAASGETRTFDFNADVVGKPPRGFLFGNTAGVGAPGEWVVEADGTNHCLAQTGSDATRSRFPVAVSADVSAADLDLSVRFKPVSGEVDQAAGLVWRYQDANNYYIVRANALEGNVVLYKVESGKRTDLPLTGEGRTYGKKVGGTERSLEHVAGGGERDSLRGVLRGSKLYEVHDSTFTGAGKVGVWTKADSVTQFDDLTVITK